MAVIAIGSAKGAPGVSTSALALTLAWPRAAVLVEADPAGSSSLLAGFLRGQVPHDRSVVQLAQAARAGGLDVAAFWAAARPLTDDHGRAFVAGPQDAAQARGLAELWGPLAELLPVVGQVTGLDVDVIVDLGRWGTAFEPTPLATAADLLLLATGSSLPQVAGVVARLATHAPSDPPTISLPQLRLLLVGPGRPYSADEIARRLKVDVAATLEHDPRTALALSEGAEPPPRLPTTPLMRSAASAAVQLLALADFLRSARGTNAPTRQEAVRA